MTVPRLLLLSREGCCLCDELEDELREAFGSADYVLERADVDADEHWREAYGSRIPVLLGPASELLSEFELDRERVAAFLGRPVPGQ